MATRDVLGKQIRCRFSRSRPRYEIYSETVEYLGQAKTGVSTGILPCFLVTFVSDIDGDFPERASWNQYPSLGLAERG